MNIRFCTGISQSLPDKINQISDLDRFVQRTNYTLHSIVPRFYLLQSNLSTSSPITTTELVLASTILNPPLLLLIWFPNLTMLFMNYWVPGQWLLSWCTCQFYANSMDCRPRVSILLCLIPETFLLKFKHTPRFTPTQMSITLLSPFLSCPWFSPAKLMA